MYNTDVWELTADFMTLFYRQFKIKPRLYRHFEITGSNKFQRNQWFFLLVDSNNDRINLNEKKWISWREALLIKHGQFDLNHMVASPQTFLVFMDFHDEKKFQTQELMLAFRLACCVTKHKDFLFPIYKGPCRILSKF